QLDYANILRLSSQSQVKIADLSRTRIQIQVSQGYVNYSMFKGSEADVEIDTPNVAVHPSRHGRYLVEVLSDMETNVIVRDGEAEVTTPQGSTRVKEGEMIAVRGVDNPEYKIAEAPSRTDWDRWNQDRDNLIKDANAWRKTNSYYTGAHDLDTYGRWVYVPGYGDVWQPYQQASWAPYQVGRWVWEPYWGWTWVSYEPWGWAPYHYGRWFVWGSSWVWWPGPVYRPYYRPVWSPAFVVFVGFGHGGGFGSIGWFPCGPHDYFYPWYGRGFNRVNVVNVTNINVTNVNVINRTNVIAPLGGAGQRRFSNANLVLTDARVRGSVTTVSAQDFGHNSMNNRRFGVDAAEMRQGSVMTANLPVVPTRESLHAGGAAAAGIPARNDGRFFTHRTPPTDLPAFHDQAADVGRVVQAHNGSVGGFDNAGGQGHDRFNRGQDNAGGGTKSIAGPLPPENNGRPVENNGRPVVPDGNGRMSQGGAVVNNNPTKTGGSSDGWRGFGNGHGHNNNSNAGQGQGSEEMMKGRPVVPDNGARMSQGGAQTGQPATGETKAIRPLGGPDRTNGSDGQRGGSSDGWRGFGNGNGNGNGRTQQNNNNGPAQGPGAEEMMKGRPVIPSGDSSNGPRMAQGGASGNNPVRTGGNDAAGGNGGQNRDRSGWSKFGGRPDGSPQGGGQQNDNGRGSRNDSIQQDRGGQPRVNDNRDRFDRSSYKPPLEMNKPVVTPRDERRISAPSYTQDSRHNSYSPPPPPRSEVHSAPPSHSSGGSYGGGGGSRSSGGGGSSGGSHNSGSSGGNHSSGGNNGGSKDSGSGKHQR
ncbi:MAG TPA: DUF6600 domain-containing protein, partial [Candidatus Angelobacter sp.]|nr:DUF6600 domain-containing protein [Candidatus Angelobacter sp.]